MIIGIVVHSLFCNPPESASSPPINGTTTTFVRLADHLSFGCNHNGNMWSKTKAENVLF